MEWQHKQRTDWENPTHWLAFRRELNALDPSYLGIVLAWAHDCMLHPEVLAGSNPNLYGLLSKPWLNADAAGQNGLMLDDGNHMHWELQPVPPHDLLEPLVLEEWMFQQEEQADPQVTWFSSVLLLVQLGLYLCGCKLIGL